jgi:exopolysaccharide biosynthesis protein
MNIDYAINLDGGGSTKILKDGKSLTSILYNRSVDNVIAFWLKNKPIYRV